MFVSRVVARGVWTVLDVHVGHCFFVELGHLSVHVLLNANKYTDSTCTDKATDKHKTGSTTTHALLTQPRTEQKAE